MSEKGIRVGAILSSNDVTVEFLGYGTYVGDEIPKEAVGWLAEIGIPNPKIQLDSGKVVYGCECWWGPEKRVSSMLAKYKKVVNVDIDEVRKNHK